MDSFFGGFRQWMGQEAPAQSGTYDWFNSSAATPWSQQAPPSSAYPNQPSGNQSTTYANQPQAQAFNAQMYHSRNAPQVQAQGKPPAEIVDPEALSKAVQHLAETELNNAWKKLRSEFETLQLVWESTNAIESRQPAHKRDEKAIALRGELSSKLKQALSVSEHDRASATELLRPLSSKRDGADASQLNNGTAGAIVGVIKGQQRHMLKLRLAHTLTSVRSDEHLSDTQKQEYENLIKACNLNEALDQSKIRRALGLGPSKAELQKERLAKAEAIKKARAREKAQKIAQIAEAAGVSKDKADKAIVNAGGDIDLALVMLLSEKDAVASEKGRKAKEKAMAAQAKADARKSQRMAELTSVVSAVSQLASITVKSAWEALKMEFETQVNVWNSQAVLGSSRNYGHVEQAMDGIFQIAGQDQTTARIMLEELMLNAGGVLSAAVNVAASKTVSAEQLTMNRRNLASRLEALAGSIIDDAVDDADLVAILPYVEWADLDRRLEERVNAVLFGGGDLPKADRIRSL